MASDPAALKAAYLVEVAKISNVLDKAEATYLVDVWADAVDKQSALEANDIVSYSIGGRTFTRRDVAAGQEAIAQLRYEIRAFIYGTTTLIDNNTSGIGDNE